MRKQHKNNIAPLTRELGKRKKEKSARRGFSPATHWVVTQALRTCVHLYCILAMRKQHKNIIAPLTRELGKRKKICATRIFSGHPLGRDTSPTYVCALVLFIGNAQTTQKQHCPIDQGAWQKEKTKIRATRILSDHPLGRDSSPTYVCALVLYIGNAQTTQKQNCPIDQVAWQNVKIKIRATRIFSDHPLGRDRSPTYVCALVLYIGNAQTTQKQHCPIDQGAWQREKNLRDADFLRPPTGS